MDEMREVLWFSRDQVANLLSLEDCIAGVEEAFRKYHQGEALAPGVLGVASKDGGFHIKAAGLHLSRTYFATKINGNFPDNRRLHGLPLIQGIIVLCDGDTGSPLAIMDSIEITILRTGAATAVAAKYLAGDGPLTATICGCGNQGRVQLQAVAKVRRIRNAFASDADPKAAEEFARRMTRECGFEVQATNHLKHALSQSSMCITCTPSQSFYINKSDIVAGTFVAGVGADNPAKQELDPLLFADTKIVVDVLDQCAEIGDLHHAITAGVVKKEDVYAELGEIVSGKKPGRESADEIIVFDSTGTAIQDVIAAAVVYERGKERGIGTVLA
jgi:ornithine cyclodeaminase/alanine dehydrogenase-like protein (mu-crystallin family)